MSLTLLKSIKQLIPAFLNRKPRNSEALTQCTRELLQSRPTGICDYQEFVNSPKGFEIQVAKEFQIGRVKLWASILNEDSSGS